METARIIMAALAADGQEAYIVGGAVRDLLRGVQPNDIDIATNATPDRITAVAEANGWKAIPVGAAFGVITVVANNQSYEVATFRSERYGIDSHRPEAVTLGVALAEDLARRDFTINAMAMAADGKIIDLFGGQQDLKAKLIRTVGKPEERFAEDGLRMFRAARFAARMGFDLETITFAAIPSSLERIKGLSVERVRTEIEKTLLSPFAARGLDIMLKSGLLAGDCLGKEQGRTYHVPILPELCHLDGLSQNPRYHLYDAWRHTLAVIELVPCNLTLRWAALLHDVAKGWPEIRTTNREGQPSDPGHDKAGAQAAAVILHRLRVDRQVAEQVEWLIRHHLMFPVVEEKVVLKWLKRLSKEFKGPEAFKDSLERLFSLHQADREGGHTQPDIVGLQAVRGISDKILAEVPFFPSQLVLAGGEIANKLGGGPEVGRFQQNLLTRIQAGQLANTKESLKVALASRVRRLTHNAGEKV